jgi:GNAT superfamily N-acetyltransferase
VEARVRPAELEDAAGIARVHVLSWQGAYPHIFGDALDELSVNDRAEMWRGWLGGSYERRSTLVAEANDEIVGFASVGPARDPDAGADAGELDAIYLLPGAWGQGIGASLMNEALVALHRLGFASAVLWVLEDNPRARLFYERGG